MNRVLLDSSIWIEYFRGSNPKISHLVNQLIDSNNVHTNDIILAELIPFLRVKKQIELIQILNSLERFEVNIDWGQIMDFQTVNLKNGINKVGIPDLIILQNSIQNKGVLFSLDKHFPLMRKYLKFELMSV